MGDKDKEYWKNRAHNAEYHLEKLKNKLAKLQETIRTVFDMVLIDEENKNKWK